MRPNDKGETRSQTVDSAIRGIWGGALRIRAVVLDCVHRGKEDGSIRRDVDALRFAPLLSASYNGVMQRLPLLESGNLSEAQRQSQAHVFDDYIATLREYLSPGP